MKKNFGDYYLGLDIGTESVGWAVTDLNYKVQKLNGKALWGIRLFEKGQTAEERRLHRASRRRLQRRKQRIQLLQEIFAEEIAKVDPGFFQRMKESKYWPEDKSFEAPYAIFAEKNYTDKNYHKDFPTIYHLRKDLIEKKEKFDIRLIYLAIHHILKKRGHFLFEGQRMSTITSFSEVFNNLKNVLWDELEIDINLGLEELKILEATLKKKSLNKTEKKKVLNELLIHDKKDEQAKQKKAIVALLIGSPAKINDLFPEIEIEATEISKVDFSSNKYEENFDQLTNILEDKILCLEQLRTVYSWAILAEIRRGFNFFSQKKVDDYLKHKKDLKILKEAIKEYYPEKYKNVFDSPEIKGNYCAYTGHARKNMRKLPIKDKCTKEEFYKFITSLISKKIKESETLQYIKAEIEKGTFLPRQVTKDNGVIPYQMHLEELETILKNVSTHYDFLNKTDQGGITNAEKIKKILTFRIPYYVGPVNDSHKSKDGNCWVVKKAPEPVRPWNFEKVVDCEKSAEQFIRRMTNKCSYLTGADVLPKNSLLYSEYMALNELNNLKINGEKISVELKNKIFQELLKETNKVTIKKLRKFLENNGIISKTDLISGIDESFKASLKSFHDFRNILGDKLENQQIIEKIILWITLFDEAPGILKKKINSEFGSFLSDSEINKILKLKYSGWGRLSKEFLTEIIHVDKATGECFNIISALRGEIGANLNLMQLLSNKYDFSRSIEKYNEEQLQQSNEISYNLVKDLYASPAVKRGIWQTLRIVKEIVKIMQKPPLKIFIEVAREDGQKKRTISRKTKLQELYKACKNESREWAKELENTPEGQLRSKRLFLYYTQMGRCLYSGEPIDLSNLFNKNIYDIDHIFPRSKVKDDSLDNLVLVKRNINTSKSNEYPLSPEIQKNCSDWWRMLYQKGFVSKKKFDRLLRTTPFDDNELADFIARQLVETRQSTKAVAQVLNQVFKESETVYVKAGSVSEFRQNFDLVKVREVNDLHHARDAYLNIVVGNVLNTKFTRNPLNYIKNAEGRKYNLRQLYNFNVERNGIKAWEPGSGGTINQIKKTMKKNNILFTRYATEQKGGLFKQNILKKGHGQLPVKADPKMTIEKYGGYDKVVGTYFMLVEHEKKKKNKIQKIRSLEFIPLHLAKKLENNDTLKAEYCKTHLNLINPVILLPKIRFKSLLKIDGFRLHLTGRTNNRLALIIAEQLCLDIERAYYTKTLTKLLNRIKENGEEFELTSQDKITREKNLKLFETCLFKLKNTIYSKKLSAQIKTLEEGLEIFKNLNLIEQCQTLKQILNLFQGNRIAADLSKINGPKNAGLINLNNLLSNFDSAELINQSVTGVFERKIDLLNLKR
ncbi:MAG: type II CRISPR RNA-guided endonuclease Cas9 [Candidatus Rifleibacteriota bacterium]